VSLLAFKPILLVMSNITDFSRVNFFLNCFIVVVLAGLVNYCRLDSLLYIFVIIRLCIRKEM